MKAMRIVSSTLLILLVSVPYAFASTTTKVYSSNILILAFLAICAMVVVFQLIPAIVVLFGMVKGLAKKGENSAIDKAESVD